MSRASQFTCKTFDRSTVGDGRRSELGRSESTNVVLVATKERVTSALKRVVVNEILAYLHFYRSNSNSSGMREIILQHFSAAEISDAKNCCLRNF